MARRCLVVIVCMIASLFLFVHSVSAYPLAKSFVVVATGYAPLDPKAVEGVCYYGNRYVTASGARTTPGITIAAPRHIPFGTWLYLEDIGWRRVEDRGGSIKGNQIDICFRTRSEALRWGRKVIRAHAPIIIRSRR